MFWNNLSDITTISASCGGNISADEGSSVTARGVCWSTGSNPTISNSSTSNGYGLGSFASKITGLSAGFTYYVRAYATNSIGTSYGTQITLTTPAFNDGTVGAMRSATVGAGINIVFLGDGFNITDITARNIEIA